MSTKQDFSQRLRNAMERQGYKASATLLEHEFNLRCQTGMAPISTQAAWNWLNGKAIPTHEKMLVLAAWLKTEPATLLFGNAWTEARQAQPADMFWSVSMDHLDRKFMDAYLALPVTERRLLQEIMRRFSLAQQIKPKKWS